MAWGSCPVSMESNWLLVVLLFVVRRCGACRQLNRTEVLAPGCATGSGDGTKLLWLVLTEYYSASTTVSGRAIVIIMIDYVNSECLSAPAVAAFTFDCFLPSLQATVPAWVCYAISPCCRPYLLTHC